MQPVRGHREFPSIPAIVVSHDCEFTKVSRWGGDYCLLVAPLRRVSTFDTGQGEPGMIRKNAVRFLFCLPHLDPLDDEYAADLTRIQPMTAAELLDETLWTSMGPALKPALQGALLVFFTDRKPRTAS